MASGDNVDQYFRLESGIHRVQRVPPTETKGRRHTSTIAVAVLPCDDVVESDYNKDDFKIDCTTGQGAGGQHRNRNYTAIRVTHVPTGITAWADSKSQYHNKKNAMSVVIAKLKQVEKEEGHENKNNDRISQIGDMGRGTKVRTYNFIEGRVKDERVSGNFKADKIIKGHLDVIYNKAGVV